MANDHFETSIDATASFLGISSRRLSELKSRPGFPKKNRRGYPLSKIVHWMRQHGPWQKNHVDDSAGNTTRGELSHRLLAADVVVRESDGQTREVKLAEIRGELVSRTAVYSEVRKMHSFLRRRLEQIPSEMALAFPAETRSQGLNDLSEGIRMLLKELSDTLEHPEFSE